MIYFSSKFYVNFFFLNPFLLLVEIFNYFFRDKCQCKWEASGQLKYFKKKMGV